MRAFQSRQTYCGSVLVFRNVFQAGSFTRTLVSWSYSVFGNKVAAGNAEGSFAYCN